MVAAVAPAPSRPERILLVEDDEFSNQLIEMYLRKCGFDQIAIARDGREALEMARGGGFDLMLLDLNLPRLNGPEVLRRLAKEESLSQTSVLVISSITNTEATANSMEHGAEDYLPKPFNKQLLESRVLSILNRRRLQADLAGAAKREAEALAAARHLRQAATDASLSRLGGAAAQLSLAGGGFLGTAVEVAALPDGSIAVLVAEAAAPGLGGGLAALAARAEFALAAATARPGASPQALLDRVAETAHAAVAGDGALNLCVCHINPTAGTVQVVGSGLPAPLVVHGGGGVEMVRATPAAPVAFQPGDLLVLSGAGVNHREAMNGPQGFSLRAAVSELAGSPPRALVAGLRAQLSAAGPALPTDLTVVALTLPVALPPAAD